ncbi:hypothetical protein [Cupriavidus sp. CuC1]|uniref:hypothetical protein n=1 Tax=Cupriavidus sp. CuC1 TaxID=3373131 RepID=UPI0037CEED17
MLVRTLVAGLALSSLAACTTPMAYTDKPMTPFDRDTEYAVEDTPGGFALTVNYGRYQFIPESAAVATACKAALTSVAHDVAQRKGRQIEQVNEQRIKLSIGRNGFSGVTSCSATAPIAWKG